MTTIDTIKENETKERVLVEKDHIEWEHIGVLRQLEVPCVSTRDGRGFKDRTRLDKIEQIVKEAGDEYLVSKIGDADIYMHKNLKTKDIILITSHCDTIPDKPFVKYNQETDLLHGTFDNIITNAVLTILMKEHSLPENIVVAFTGDEETGRCRGCKDTVNILKKYKFNIIKSFALDVTYEGYHSANFSFENYVRKDKKDKETSLYKAFESIIDTCKDATETKSGGYDEAFALANAGCREYASFCLPMTGQMHHNDGGYVKERTFEGYILALTSFIYTLTNSHKELVEEYKMMRDKYKPERVIYTPSSYSISSDGQYSFPYEDYGMTEDEFLEAREARLDEIRAFYKERDLEMPDYYIDDLESIPGQYNSWEAYDCLSNAVDEYISDLMTENADSDEIDRARNEFIADYTNCWEFQLLYNECGYYNQEDIANYLKEMFDEGLALEGLDSEIEEERY